MKRLKTILQSNITYLFLLIFIIIYIIIFTVIIKYETNINSNIIEGTIIDLDINEDKILFILSSTEKVRCTYYIKEKDNINFKDLLGKKVLIKGVKKELYNNTIPNTFNYKKYLYNNKIYLNFTVDSIEILKGENIFYKFKNYIIKKINNFNDLSKTYLNIFILGDKSYLEDNNYNNYRVNGIWHLFAISGMHISLIITILDKLLGKIKFKTIIVSLILFYFMFLTGFSTSVQRTTIFYIIKKFLNYFNIQISNEKILFLTAFIILSINPFLIYNSGFQYSFLISLAIMLESKYITGNYIMKIFKLSIISFIVSLPITVNMNYEINLMSIFLNIFYVPFITFIVFPLSIMTFIFPFLSCIFIYFIYILEFSNEFFCSLKFNLIIPEMSIYLILVYYLILYVIHKTRKLKYLFLLIGIIIINFLLVKLDNNYYLYFIDVGQGDSSIITNPWKNKTIMIDTGGNQFTDYKVTNNTILFLKSKGIQKIDYFIITHGDYDHMGESVNLVNNFKVEKVIFNCGEYNDLEQDLIKVLNKKKIPYYSCVKELNIADNKLYFLNDKNYGNENDNSSVIYTELNNRNFLFMGDAGIEVEEDLIEKYNLQDIDVLKVGHHGSKTSSSIEFIDEINPKYSIISVGKNNRYGHPNKEALENLEDSKIYRTDQDGSIMFKIKNNKLEIETCSP